MKAIVTGAAGFIGSHVAEKLLQSGHEVIGLDDLSGSFESNIPTGIDFIKFDSQGSATELFRRIRPDLVYHLAAYAAEGLSHHIPAFNYQNNLVATANVLTASFLSNVKHFVFTSSIAAYGHPLNCSVFKEDDACNPCDPYGIAKYACELHIKAFFHYHGGPTYSIFRPHNVFGPRQNISDPYRNVVGIFMRCALQGKPMPIFGNGSQTRSFSYIDLVANCIAQSPFIPSARNEVFNIGGDESMSVLQLATIISSVMKVPETIQFLQARDEVAHAHCCHEKIRRVFADAYRNEIDIETGLERMAEYIKTKAVPPTTECPSEIEIENKLPPSWRK